MTVSEILIESSLDNDALDTAQLEASYENLNKIAMRDSGVLIDKPGRHLTATDIAIIKRVSVTVRLCNRICRGLV